MGKRIIAVILVAVGVGLYLVGNYIEGEVAHGRKKISSAQKTVDQGRTITGLSPVTKDIGDIATSSAQRKIDEGREEADAYEELAGWLHGGGIILFIAGSGLLVFTFIRKKKS